MPKRKSKSDRQKYLDFIDSMPVDDAEKDRLRSDVERRYPKGERSSARPGLDAATNAMLNIAGRPGVSDIVPGSESLESLRQVNEFGLLTEPDIRPNYSFPDTPEGRSSAKELVDRLPENERQLRMRVRIVPGLDADGNDVMTRIGADRMAESIQWYENQGRARTAERTADFVIKNPELFTELDVYEARRYRAIVASPESAKDTYRRVPTVVTSSDLNVGDRFTLAGEARRVESIDPETGAVRISGGIELPEGAPIAIDRASIRRVRDPGPRPGGDAGFSFGYNEPPTAPKTEVRAMSQFAGQMQDELLRVAKEIGLTEDATSQLIERLMQSGTRIAETDIRSVTQRDLASIAAQGKLDAISARTVASVDEMKAEAQLKEESRIRRLSEANAYGAQAARIIEMYPNTAAKRPGFIRLIGLLRSTGDVGASTADALAALASEKHSSAVGSVKAAIEDEASRRGVTIDAAEVQRLAESIPAESHRSIRRIVGERWAAKEAEAKKIETTNENIAQQTARIMEESAFGDPRRRPEVAERIARADVEGKSGLAAQENIRAARTGRGIRMGATTGLATLVALMGPAIIGKIFSGGDSAKPGELPPQMQMMLAMQLAKQSGGGGGGEMNTSKVMTDMTKLLSMIKMLGSFGGTAAPQTPVAALI